MVPCKYYDESACSETCEQDWCKCVICKRYIDPCGDNEFINSYVICSAYTNCDYSDIADQVIVMCSDCYKKLRIEKESESDLSEPLWKIGD